MTQQVQFIQTTPEQLKTAIVDGVKFHLDQLKESFQPITPTEYLGRAEVAKLLKVDISTVHNWTVKKILISYQIGRRVLYKREEVENAIVKLQR